MEGDPQMHPGLIGMGEADGDEGEDDEEIDFGENEP